VLLRLNPSLTPDAFASAYAAEGYVQIPNIFEPEAAERLTQILEREIDWEFVFLDENQRGVALTPAQQQALGEAELARLSRGVDERARFSLGLRYLGYTMTDALLRGRDPGHPIHDLTSFIHGADFLRFAAAVAHTPSAVRAEAQASCYRPGDFIGLHDDTGREAGNRLAAYTLGFTRRWRSDWGGQLIFHDNRGDIERGLAPRWNMLTLFRVPRLHSVAPVSAYAGAPRLSVVGWLRDDPIPRI